MKLRLRRWAPVLVAALGFAVLAWLVASASLSGHQLVTPGVPPAGLPPKALEYLPDDFIDNFPDGVDLASDSAEDLPPELLDSLEGELTPAELAELSRVLSDDVMIELAKRHAGELSPQQIQEIWDGLDSETREQVLDEIAGEYTQEELDQIADQLSPELYKELSERAESENEPVPSQPDEPDTSAGETDTETGDTSEPAPTEEQPSPSPQAQEEKKDESGGFLDWLKDLGPLLLTAVKWLLVLAVAALACYILYRIISALSGWKPRRRAKEAPAPVEAEAPGPEVEKLREAVAEGLSDLTEATDPRRGVIACWQRLEAAAAAAGLARRAAETPGELVSRVLTAAKVDPAALTDLADAYRRARYGPHEIGEDLRRQAVAALAAVDAQLAEAASTIMEPA